MRMRTLPSPLILDPSDYLDGKENGRLYRLEVGENQATRYFNAKTQGTNRFSDYRVLSYWIGWCAGALERPALPVRTRFFRRLYWLMCKLPWTWLPNDRLPAWYIKIFHATAVAAWGSSERR